MGSSSGRPHQPIRYFLHAQFTVTRMVSWCDAEFGFSPDLVNWVGTLAVWGCSDGRRQRTKHLGHIHSQIPRHVHLDRLHCTHLTLTIIETDLCFSYGSCGDPTGTIVTWGRCLFFLLKLVLIIALLLLVRSQAVTNCSLLFSQISYCERPSVKHNLRNNTRHNLLARSNLMTRIKEHFDLTFIYRSTFWFCQKKLWTEAMGMC